MKFSMRCTRFVFPAVGLLFATTLRTHATEPVSAEAIVKYRQSVMLSQRGHIRAAAAIIKGKVDYNDQLLDHVKALAATTNNIAKLFPEGSDAGETRALKAVWSDKRKFQKRFSDTQQKSAMLLKAVNAGDSANYASHLDNLLDSCKACHKDFRKKVEK